MDLFASPARAQLNARSPRRSPSAVTASPVHRERALARLAAEYAAAGRLAEFSLLKARLLPGRASSAYPAAEAVLGASAVRAAVARLRLRYRQLVRREAGRSPGGHDDV